MEKAKHEAGDTLTVTMEKPLEGNVIAPPIKIGQTHVLQVIHTCSCGQHHYDIGLPSEYNYIRCYKCKKELPSGDSVHWCHPSRFE
jgi:hypothetical protein